MWALSFSASPLLAQDHTEDFTDFYDLIYQIKVVSSQAGSKSSIGSGFQVSADGLLITNYHVVSTYVQSPETHEIQYQTQSGELGNLELLDFDIINDLAVLRHSRPAERYFKFSDSTLNKGDTVYALGNPRDYGVILVPGPNNGLVEHSYDDQILFSASLNPGMSGGPALNSNGNVVGVNVATAGSQLSFLVPADKAKVLVRRNRQLAISDYQNEIAAQIKDWQRPRIQELIDGEWPIESFADKDYFGEIRRDFQCWGNTNEADKERLVDRIEKTCSTQKSIYLGSQLSAGNILFSFYQRKSIKLNSSQFANTISNNMYPDNGSDFENSSNYRCEVDFLKSTEPSKEYHRVTYCVRSYKRLLGLFDSLLMVQKIGSKQVNSDHLSISAVEKDQMQSLNRKFIEKLL
jgi:hypothetical protein